MQLQIRPYTSDDLQAVVELSLLAWAPVFESFEQVLGSSIFTRIYPDWHASQRENVATICSDQEKYDTWVAEAEGAVAGFVVLQLDHTHKTGEIELLAVHPDYQNHEIGTDLNLFALDRMRESGMKLAVVGTGGDAGHAPARRSYEKAGFIGLPLVRYYQEL